MRKLCVSGAFFTLFIAFFQPALGQGEQVIKGIIVDSLSKSPIQFATVNLLSKIGVNKVAVANETGGFVISGIKLSVYTIVISNTGYQNKRFDISVDSLAKEVNLGTISLNILTKELKDVTVTANKPIIRKETDRLIYDMQSDPESKVRSVLEIMRKAPYLSVDGDGNLLFKGNGSYRILINGRPSGLVERNPKEILQSMPASTIQRIEIITTPPSKYDAEGLAGIINIITIKKVVDGYTGSMNLSEKFPIGGPGLGFSFASKSGKFGFNSYGGGNIYKSPLTDFNNNRKTADVTLSQLSQNGSKENRNTSRYLGVELSYEIDSLRLLFINMGINGNQSKGSLLQNTILSTSAGLYQAFDQNNINKGDGQGIDGSINYQVGFKKNKSKLFTFSYRYFTYRNAANSSVDIFNKVSFSMPNYVQDNVGTSSEHTGQIDYVQNVKGVNIEAGVKGIFRLNESEFNFRSYNGVTGNYEIDPSRSNNFSNRQDVLSAYNSYQYSSKKWDYKGGVRLEQTLVNADFVSTATKVKQNYLNLVPSLLINRRFENNSFINLAFVQRIKRPGITRLNPFVDRSNPNFEVSGNPELRPVILNVIQLGYGISKKVSINVSTDYSFGRNLDIRISVYDTASKITRSTYRNTGKASRLGFDYNVNFPISKKWKASVNGNFAYFWLEGDVGGVYTKIKQTTQTLSLSTSYDFSNDWQSNANFNIASKNPVDLQVMANELVTYSFGVSKRLIKDKFTLSATVNNPFKKYRNNITATAGPDFEQVYLVRDYFVSYSFSINYQFGKMQGQIKRNWRSINNNDVSN